MAVGSTKRPWDLQNGDGLDGKQSLADLSVTVALCIRTECQYFVHRCRLFDVSDVNIQAIMHRKQRPGASSSMESFIEMPTYFVFP
ncbi:hypothetical protein DPMN_019322 [Dreissena polymorpha]|nr:hypothetical protein DPMN_065393 [Dreissena polymorpha]KAH3769480.1 hypothetical protein DPMN_170748 [Dreissena polymorpha]KAH3769503.1 hypothetical protein DPMN_170772 [Dreissena polymorpha]KAH3801631.1 hypothetical protein DPMN_155289 [Dreissena polymorpha]KAH3835513.1 hypothetical protein DPMN_108866 [Dreissena polymorpha]